MSNAPQGAGGAHAEGGHAFSLDGTAPNVDLGNGPLDNRIASIDITKIGNDTDGDHDYDDPYPGGPTGTLGVPGDG